MVEAASTAEELEDLVGRRVAGEPLEQVLGWAEFCGMRILLDPGVFVPRRRTELVVRQTLQHLAGRGRGQTPPVVVDLCCGSGAIGAAVLAALPDAQVHAADVDPAALLCARRNLGPHRVYGGDLYDALPGDLRGRVDVLAVNAPYVPSSAIASMPPEARDHEPRRALDGGTDGLDVARRVATDAVAWLAPNGLLVVETSTEQAPTLADAVEESGLQAQVVTEAELGGTVVRGTPPQGGNRDGCSR